MVDFTEDFTCINCARVGAPISDEASADSYDRGWHVTCPACEFSVSGPDKAKVMHTVAVLAMRTMPIGALFPSDGSAG